MNNRTILLAILTSMVAIDLPARQAIVKDAQEETFREFVLNYDPSSVAVSNDHQSAYWSQPYLERWRIVTDLNGDGKDDLILSDTKESIIEADYLKSWD